jgi:hypothetical protein
VFFVLAPLSPPALQPHLTVFALAIVIGYYVIGHDIQLAWGGDVIGYGLRVDHRGHTARPAVGRSRVFLRFIGRAYL